MCSNRSRRLSQPNALSEELFGDVFVTVAGGHVYAQNGITCTLWWEGFSAFARSGPRLISEYQAWPTVRVGAYCRWIRLLHLPDTRHPTLHGLG
jgi:hypothetical protein